MPFADFVDAIKGTEDFDSTFAQSQPSSVYIVTVAVLKIINRVTFTLMIYRLLSHLETYGFTLPFP